MRCTSQKTNRRTGFTLVEVLIIAPIVILMITAFVVLIITITGEVLRMKGTNDLIYNTQDALSRIDQDVKRTTEFRKTSYTPTSPQGQDDNTTAFDMDLQASTYLVLRTITTDKSPLVDTRQLIYKLDVSTCTTTPYTMDIIYFTKVVNGVTSLWRRVIQGNTTDAGSPCTGTTPWQVPTCSPGYTNTTACKADDSLILENVTTASVLFLNAAGDQINTTGPGNKPYPYDAAGTNASSITVTLGTSNAIAGRDSSYTASLTSGRI